MKPIAVSVLPLLFVGAVACTGTTPASDEPQDTDTGEPVVIDDDNDGYAAEEDCDDTDASINPGAEERVNDGIDQNCDGLEQCPTDADGDGYGDQSGGTSLTEALDCVGVGIANNSEDCDDSSDVFNPAAVEDDCTDPNDYNCDGSTGYADADMDGFAACEDCDDSNADIRPDADERPGDEQDQNCDNTEICFVDTDNDGYRPDDTATVSSNDIDCQDDGEATASDPTGDCLDNNAEAYPGATEIWYDGIDQDCAEDSDYDQDKDGVDAKAFGGTDCDDTDASINPSASEIPQNGIDEDCDGSDAPYTVSDLSVGDLVITEVMRNPKAVTDGNGEWFEVLNQSGGTVDLDGLYVYDDGSNAFTVSSALLVADGAYVVFGNNGTSASNGGVSVDYAYSGASMSLGNGDDELYLAESSSKTVVIDDVSWNDDYYPDTEGAAATLDADYDTATENDHEGNWCDATTSYGSGDTGTPGAANDSCGFTYVWSDVASVLASKCSGCHTTGASGGLSGITTWSNVVWVYSTQSTTTYLIDPFSAADSYIWQKIDGTATVGDAMPKGTGSLSSTEESTIKTWINEGAPQ